jgi:hypothetical protein
MKKLLLILAAVMLFINCQAQDAEFPFQGGKDVMMNFFGEHLKTTPLIAENAATGLVVMKFTADQKGKIIKMIVYYADDAILTEPIVNVLRQTNGKWIVPANEKSYDFIIPFSIQINPSSNKHVETQMFNFYKAKQPIISVDQIPLNMVTLLPTIKLSYDLPELKKSDVTN